MTVLQISLRSTAQPITVTIRANYTKDIKVYHDEPLLLVVSLTNEQAQENGSWNKAADRGLEGLEELLKAGKIKKEEYDREKTRLTNGKKPVPAVTIGAAGKPWSSLIRWRMINTSTHAELVFTTRTMANPSTDDIAVLDDKGYYAAYFGIDADKMKGIPAGMYELIATVENENSEPVNIEIKNEAMPAMVASGEEMLLKMGQYHWHAGDAAKGMQYADQLLRKNPVSVDGLSLKGDLQVLNNSYADALTTFSQAAKEYYKQNGAGTEPPEYLLKMIAWVKEQLGK